VAPCSWRTAARNARQCPGSAANTQPSGRRVPGALEQAIRDADTFFGIELPALTEWTFGPEHAAATDQPVLSVLGNETQPLWVEVAEFLRSSLPHVDERIIDGVGHLLHIQRPEPVARAMAEFLRRHCIGGDRLEAFDRPSLRPGPTAVPR
jgi:pimeloyl-ACP methyl ester carboxylesterase